MILQLHQISQPLFSDCFLYNMPPHFHASIPPQLPNRPSFPPSRPRELHLLVVSHSPFSQTQDQLIKKREGRKRSNRRSDHNSEPGTAIALFPSPGQSVASSPILLPLLIHHPRHLNSSTLFPSSVNSFPPLSCKHGRPIIPIRRITPLPLPRSTFDYPPPRPPLNPI